MNLRNSGYRLVTVSSAKEVGNGLGVPEGLDEIYPVLPVCVAVYLDTPIFVMLLISVS